MSDLTIALLSLVIGVAATLAVGRYYFRRTVSKSLSVYLHSSSQLFRGLATEVRRQLKIDYKGVPVEDLQEIQFLVANTGERAIRDLIKPLSLAFPEGCALLDATLAHVHPKEREIALQTTERTLDVTFPLLNHDDFFVMRLLIRGHVKTDDLRFTITADDLPPALIPSWAAPDLIMSDEKRSFEYGLLMVSGVTGLFGWGIAWLVYYAWTSTPHTRAGVLSYLPDSIAAAAASIFAAFPALMLIIIAVGTFFGAFTNFSFPPRKRFVVPKDIVRSRRQFVIDEREAFHLSSDDAR